MRGMGLRLSVTLLTVIPWRGAGRQAADDTGGDTAPPRATVAAAMAWAPAVGLLLGVIASAVLLVADHPLGAGPLTAAGLAVGLARPAQPGPSPRRAGRPGGRPGQRQARPRRAGHHAPLRHRAARHRHARS